MHLNPNMCFSLTLRDQKSVMICCYVFWMCRTIIFLSPAAVRLRTGKHVLYVGHSHSQLRSACSYFSSPSVKVNGLIQKKPFASCSLTPWLLEKDLVWFLCPYNDYLQHYVAKIFFGKMCQIVKKVLWHNGNGTHFS